MAEEQAALLRVAALVARGGRDDEIYDAVTAEATRVIDEVATLVRFDEADSYRVISREGVAASAGLLVDAAPGADAVIAEIQSTRRAARVASISDPSESVDDRSASGGPAFTFGVPVLVGQRLWGALYASTRHRERVSTAEERLRDFCELVAAAVANAEGRARLEKLAAEQAALLRVAGLVAAAAAPQVVFDAVTAEASALLNDRPVTMVRFDSDHELVVLAAHGGPVALGTAILFEPDTLPDRVRRGATVDRVDDYTLQRDAALAARYGLAAAVSAPVSVAGRVWGTLTVTSLAEPLPAGTEDRLYPFAQLVSAALSNVQAQDKLRALVEEQAALRRVAELAAQDAPAEEVLQAVAVEASSLADVEFGMVLRYVDQDGGNQIVALDGAPDNFAVGMLAPGAGDSSVHRVWRTGRAARVDDLGQMSGIWPRLSYERGFRTSAGVPVTIRGGLWGALIVAGRGEPFPRAIEQHLANFAEIAASAIAATDARKELRLVVEEQTALRRVAELVARGAALDDVFRAAASETARLLGNNGAALMQYQDGEMPIAVAVSDNSQPLGSPVPVQLRSMLGEIRRTLGPVRIDEAGHAPLTETADDRLSAAGVGVPIIVEGRLWGALITSTSSLPLPAERETRLTPFAELVAAAIANAENRSKLTDSRARVVATADETRRRLQRDVHDGAQQRLVHTIITLKLALQAVRAGASSVDLLNEALVNAERANQELRDIVHGILPASLTRGGLQVALDWLVEDLSIPVDLRVQAPRLAASVEMTAYFIVAEAITNVVKHSRATQASVDVDVVGGTLVLVVHDDGVGGADPSAGTGLTGLFDRVEASAGTLSVTSETQGTTLRAVLPLTHPTVRDHPAH